MTANLKSKLLALARAWRAAPVSVRPMPACAARNYGHLWPAHHQTCQCGGHGTVTLTGFAGRRAEPCPERGALQPEPCATCAATCWEPPCVRWAAWAWAAAERRRADERRQQNASKADPFDEYVELLRTGHA
jgi:hypothetical protein